jgi:hypothetical protein
MRTADKTNLDFVEQETGTAHAREIDKLEAQARGNQNLYGHKSPYSVQLKRVKSLPMLKLQ